MIQSDTASPADSPFEGRYQILGELGRGSFGQVFKARQLSTGQLVALKVVRLTADRYGGDSPNRILRFRRETRLCAELSHPNIVRLIDSGETADGHCYAAFELIPGSTLKDVLAAEGKLAVAAAVHLMAQVLDALSCAHALGIVHRDLKPENVMITKTGARRNALVLDFGLGGFASEAAARSLPRITATQEVLGTPCYAAPEQLRGEPASVRSDLYSWGLMFLECLTGELPVHGASAQEVVMKQLGPEPVAIPQWLRNHPLGRVLEVVTAKRAEKRDIPIDRLLETLTTGGEFVSLPGVRPDNGALERERRQLTVACCRLTVSGDGGRQADIEEIDRLLQVQHAALAERATQAGGLVATMLADRVFLVFGYPHAQEDDARRATRLAMEIARPSDAGAVGASSRGQPRIDVAVGVHTGLVITHDVRYGGALRLPELTGVTPQIASRLVEQAAPGEVRVSVDTHRLVRAEFESEPAGECALGELSRPLPVFRLTGARRDAAGTESRVWVRDTPLMGRASQLQQLLDGWAKAGAGGAGVVLITGEAGIGKSRLVHELRLRVGAQAWIAWGCAPENQTTPLRPVIDALLAMQQSVESLLTRFDVDLAESQPLFLALLSMPPDERYPPLRLSPERQKELTLRALVDLLFRMAAARPMVLAVENLHWADPTTLELVTLVMQELRAARSIESEPGPQLLVIATTRPEFVAPWSGEDVAIIPLPRLLRAEVEAMVEGTSGRGLPASLVEQVVQRAEGVPLFVEELTRVVLESARGDDPAATPPSEVEIPTGLRDLLTARLDRVSAAARDTAQLAAVLGREFRYDLLQAVSPKDAAFLREDIAELGRAGLVFHRRSGRVESYVFRHALLRDAAYEAMTRPTRQILHQRTARVLRQQFPDVEQQRPEILALHYECGGGALLAAEYWYRAGERALKHAAYDGAVGQIERGLGLLRGLDESNDRTRLEIELLTTLGTALSMTKGYAATEVERTFAQAWGLCERLGEDIPLKVLYGIWGVQITRSDRAATEQLIPRFQRLTASTDDPVAAITAHSILGTNALWRGNLVDAAEHLRRGRQLYATDACQRFAFEYGYDPGLYSYGYGVLTLWQLGYPDQAEALRCEMLAIAERSGNPYSLSIALGFGMSLACERGDSGSALEMSERLLALAAEQHLYFWSAVATCSSGGALLQRGETESAIALIQQGLNVYRVIGVLSMYSYYLNYLAAAYLQAGRVSDGLAVVDEGLSMCENLAARFHEADLLRLKGELLQMQGDHEAAEFHLRRGLVEALDTRAQSYALRAAVSLGRVLGARHEREAARSVVREVYERFTEGFDTKDLREAAVLLAELS